MNKKVFSDRIISWYEQNKRPLPWRETRDPYKIWLSEIILQQTRISQGLPYYEAFLSNFPDVYSLAKASQGNVLRLWQGLGYYTRARNLHACAKKVVTDYGGVFPDSYSALLTLPGIGAYTAAAVASIAFGESVAVVDGNVFRVLSRVFGIDKDIASNKGKEYFFIKANELIPDRQPDVYNQAVMEFGALHCTPVNPKCQTCPLSDFCVANLRNLQHLLPVKSKKQKSKRRYFTYLVISSNGRLLMRKREPGDIWQGLYDFALLESKRPIRVKDLGRQQKEFKNLEIGSISTTYKHVLSHQQLITRFVLARIRSSKTTQALKKRYKLKSYTRQQVDRLPKPILVNRFLKESGFFKEP
ncbi:MAG: A/G-specific adenine glycosylase [Cyclobacteriaceae bacterium]|nr:A/G-specific adenine glycosylase [Cyclobacteriaceae bacterium]